MTHFRAGFSQIDITPPVGGSSFFGAATVGVHLPLRARIAILDDEERRVVLVALDLPVLPSEAVPDCGARLPMPPEWPRATSSLAVPTPIAARGCG